MTTDRDEALRALVDKLIAQDRAEAIECEAMAKRLGEKHEMHNELMRDAAQYRQSIYRYGLIRDLLTPREDADKPVCVGYAYTEDGRVEASLKQDGSVKRGDALYVITAPKEQP